MADIIKQFGSVSDFRNIGTQNVEIPNPHLFYNGNGYNINNSGVTWPFRYGNGSPTYHDGIKGRSVSLNGGHGIFPSAGVPASRKYMVSVWAKPSAYDVDTDTTWSTIATNRGHGWSDKGIHIAIYNDWSINGQVNVRAYGAASTMLYSHSGNEGTGTFTMSADEWTLITVLYDADAAYPTRVFFNGELSMYTAVDADLTAGHGNSFTVGDMINTDESAAYPFYGEIDDVVYAYGDDVWTPEQIKAYYDSVTGGQFIDYEADAGSASLGRVNGGMTYTTTPISWEPDTVDLGEAGFVDYGIIEMNGTFPSGTSTTVYTRTSHNRNEGWTSWQQLNQRNEIQSPNRRFLDIRVVMQSANGTYTPTIESIDILQDKQVLLPELSVHHDTPLVIYEDHESGLKSLGEMDNAFDIVIEEEVKGEDMLTFMLPINDMKRHSIGEEPVEMVATLGNRYYVVKEVFDRRDERGKPSSEFICEARWTELRDWYVSDYSVTYSTARNALETMVKRIFRESDDPVFDWTIGHVFSDDSVLEAKLRTVKAEWSDVLSVLRDIEETWGGELLFDTENRVIHLLGKIGTDNGIKFYYEKNLKNIERQINTYDLITRIYPKGDGDLDITTVNDGVAYLENRKWVDKLGLRRKTIPFRWQDKRYTIPLNLKEDAALMLEEMSKPNVSYLTEIRDLSALTGHEHEAFNLGDVITAVDNDLFGEEIPNRIMRRKQNVRLPENTVVELSQPKKTLADIRSRAIDDQIANMVESDPLSKTDAQQMTVFNNLLNSRADDGFSDWVHEANGTNFELANAGFSGSWSWKVVPEYGKDAQMTQTVEGVSHRSTYTVSASVATTGELTRGSSDEAFVGIKVLVYYEGEAEPETHYLAVPDITD